MRRSSQFEERGVSVDDFETAAPNCATTDEDLAEFARDGDVAAFDELYRRYARTATSYARSMLRSGPDAEDAAADAFADVFAALRHNGGPRALFRPYLMACVRNRCTRTRRQRSRLVSLQNADSRGFEVLASPESSEAGIVAVAFASLTDRWRMALWMAEVQGLGVAAIAERLELNAAATSALLHRARQAFAESYLAQHLQQARAPACLRLADKLASVIRGTAGPMTRRQVEAHVEDCPSCALAVQELTDVNASLRSVLLPPLAAGAVVAASSVAVAGGPSGALAGITMTWLTNAAMATLLLASPLAAEDKTSAGRQRVVETVATDHGPTKTHAEPIVATSAPRQSIEPLSVSGAPAVTPAVISVTSTETRIVATPPTTTVPPAIDAADAAPAVTVPQVSRTPLSTVPAHDVPNLGIPQLPIVDNDPVPMLPPLAEIVGANAPSVEPSVGTPIIALPPLTFTGPGHPQLTLSG